MRKFEVVEVDKPKEILPRVINQAIEMKPKTKSYVLSVDGRKLAPGLNSMCGDQDLFGHEKTETLDILRKI